MMSHLETLWTLPVKSQEFADGPEATLARGALVVRYDFETPSGEYEWSSFSFTRVQASLFTGWQWCTEEQVAAYDRVVEVQDSEWLRTLDASDARMPKTPLRHFRVYFDEVGCYDVAAAAFDAGHGAR
jgi:hypothetical protein